MFFLLCYHFKLLKSKLFLVAMLLKIIIGINLGIWLILVLLGKGGFVHILLLTAVGISVVELIHFYRKNLKEI